MVAFIVQQFHVRLVSYTLLYPLQQLLFVQYDYCSEFFPQAAQGMGFVMLVPLLRPTKWPWPCREGESTFLILDETGGCPAE